MYMRTLYKVNIDLVLMYRELCKQSPYRSFNGQLLVWPAASHDAVQCPGNYG